MGLPARTLYETLLPGELSLLRLLPQTGRTHQLRLHLSAVGHPLAGDWLYGTEDPALIPRPALHSYRLRLLHPVTRRWLDVTAPLPEDMRRLLPAGLRSRIKAAPPASQAGQLFPSVIRRRPLFHHLPGKALCLLPDPRQAHQTSPLIGRLQQAEPWRQIEGLVHVQGGDQLPGQQISAGITGHHQPVKPLVIEPGLAEQRRQTVDAAVRLAERASL